MSQLAKRDYPDGFDCFWLGCDSAGNVGMFLIAGQGPMPAAVLSAYDFSEVDFEQAAMELPAIGDARDVHEMWDLDEFIELARRGFYVFDWSDLMAAKTVKHRAYERMAAPTRPLQLEDLNGFLRSAAVIATIPDIDFCKETVVAIPLSLEPIQPERFKDTWRMSEVLDDRNKPHAAPPPHPRRKVWPIGMLSLIAQMLPWTARKR